ncbi:hypothetical protein M1M85_00205 [Nitrospinaceae bacterium]|nr:hypothetical protein [Nitrospinaceae bacterium]
MGVKCDKNTLLEENIMLQNKEHMKLYKRKIFSLVVIVVMLSFISEVKAFNYAEIKSGDTYDSVKNFLFQRGDKVVDFKEDLITTEYGSNSAIISDFIFVNKRFCEVRTKYGARKYGWVLHDIDKSVRDYGTPINMEPKGKAWGNGFTITWKKNNQLVNYDVGHIPMLFGKPETVVESIYTDLNYCN